MATRKQYMCYVGGEKPTLTKRQWLVLSQAVGRLNDACRMLPESGDTYQCSPVFGMAERGVFYVSRTGNRPLTQADTTRLDWFFDGVQAGQPTLFPATLDCYYPVVVS